MTVGGTTTPTLGLISTLLARGALLSLMMVFRISVFCVVLRLVVAVVEAEDGEFVFFSPAPTVAGALPGAVELPPVVIPDRPLVWSGVRSTVELPWLVDSDDLVVLGPCSPPSDDVALPAWFGAASDDVGAPDGLASDDVGAPDWFGPAPEDLAVPGWFDVASDDLDVPA